MDELSDSNDNKNRKSNLLQQFIDGHARHQHHDRIDGGGGVVDGDANDGIQDLAKQTMDTDSSWIQFQGNNNNVNDKLISHNMNACDSLTVGSGQSTSDNQQLTMDSNVEHNGIRDATISTTTTNKTAIDNNGTTMTTTATDNDDTDADDVSDNNSTDNLSFNSDDDDVGDAEFMGGDLIEDNVFLPNNLISEDDELSTNSDDCVYAYRGVDMDADQFANPPNPNVEDENDFLEMDFEPDPSSELEQDNNVVAINGHLNAGSIGLNRLSPYDVPIGGNDADTLMDYNVSLPINVVQNHAFGHNSSGGGGSGGVDHMAPATTSGIVGSNEVTAAIATASNQRRNNEFDNKSAYKGPLEHGEKAMRRKFDCSQPSSSSSASSASYYDNTVSLSTTKYTGTIPKTNRLANSSTSSIRTFRQRPTNVQANANQSGSAVATTVATSSTTDDLTPSVTELKCRQCHDRDMYGGPSSAWLKRQTSGCQQCEALRQPATIGQRQRNGKSQHGCKSQADIGGAFSDCDADDICDGIAAKRSMSFPAVNRHENGYAEQTMMATDRMNAATTDTQSLQNFELRMDDEADGETNMRNSASIYSISYTEDTIIAALVRI